MQKVGEVEKMEKRGHVQASHAECEAREPEAETKTQEGRRRMGEGSPCWTVRRETTLSLRPLLTVVFAGRAGAGGGLVGYEQGLCRRQYQTGGL